MSGSKDGFTAVVLAGGKNSRFRGEDKAFVTVGGVPMIVRTLNQLNKIFKDILVITNMPGKYKEYGNLRFATDIITEAGPLGGIYSAMRNSGSPFIFVVSCDMPYLDAGIIEDQIDLFCRLNDPDILIPKINSGIEPLHGIYRTELAARLERFLLTTKNFSIRAFMKELEVAYLDLEDSPGIRKAFSNINRPEDIP
ncbi:MAG: molybdenum cofactor guanylyltransferase [Bacteroidales bacterium]